LIDRLKPFEGGVNLKTGFIPLSFPSSFSLVVTSLASSSVNLLLPGFLPLFEIKSSKSSSEISPKVQ